MTDVYSKASNGFKDLLGHRIAEWGVDYVVLELDVAPCHLNLAGTVHGGVLASLADIAGALAGLYCTRAGNVRRAVTLSLTTNFAGQVSSGLLRVVARKRAGGTSIYFSSVEITTASNVVIAMAEAVLRYRKGSEDPAGVPSDSGY